VQLLPVPAVLPVVLSVLPAALLMQQRAEVCAEPELLLPPLLLLPHAHAGLLNLPRAQVWGCHCPVQLQLGTVVQLQLVKQRLEARPLLAERGRLG
jgi:hypothetical protein